MFGVKSGLGKGHAEARDERRWGGDGGVPRKLRSGGIAEDGITIADGVGELAHILGGDDASLSRRFVAHQRRIKWHRAVLLSCYLAFIRLSRQRLTTQSRCQSFASIIARHTGLPPYTLIGRRIMRMKLPALTG